MSGSGGGPSRWIGTGGPFAIGSQTTNCDELQFQTNLASPVEAMVKRLSIGLQLEVCLEREPVQRVVVQLDDEQVGAIVERIDDLIYCLQMGTEYCAEVCEIDDGIVRVEVKPA